MQVQVEGAVEIVGEVVADPRVVGPGDNADGADLMAQQYVQALRPLLHRELAFIRQVSAPAIEKRAKIKEAGESALKEAAERMAKQQARGMQVHIRIVGGIVPGGAAEKSAPVPRQMIQAALAEALQEAVSSEEFARYQEENAKRTARHKRAAIAFLVMRIDAVLYLSTEQREKICEALDAKWNEKWQAWMDNNQSAPGYMPSLADKLIVPLLSKTQKQVWNQQQKVDYEAMSSFEGGQDQTDPWWDAKP